MDLPTTRYDKAPSSTTMSTEKISENISSNQKESIPEKVSFLILLAVIFLTPLVFLPSQYVPIEVVKMTVISLGSLAVLILAGIGILKTKSLALPKGPIVYATAALLLSVIISTFSSVNTERAFISQGFDLGTTSTILLMFLISFFIARFLGKKQEKVFSIYAAILFSFIVIAILHIVRLLGGSDILTLGFLSSSTSTLLGRWFDLSIMSGVVGLLSLLALKFLSLGKGLKIWLSVLLVLCGVFLFLTNFSLAWWAIAIVALVIGIFEFKSKTPQGEGVLKKFFSRISFLSLVVLVIAVVFAVNQDSLRTGVTDKIGITYGESVLPWQLTLDVTADSLKEAPLFGAGPNHFVNQFLRFKPQGINLTPLWNAEFRSGFGTIPSFVTTQGLVGLVVWVIFFIFFIKSGISMLKSTGDQFKKFLITSSFFVQDIHRTHETAVQHIPNRDCSNCQPVLLRC